MISKISLRKNIQELQREVSGLRIITEVLWQAQGDPNLEIDMPSYDDPEPWAIQAYPRYCKALAKEAQQLSKVVGTELRRLKEMFCSHKNSTHV